MADPVPLALGVQSNPGRYPEAGSARLINVFMEPAGEEGKVPSPLYPVPGLAAFASLPGGRIRAMLVVSSWLYVVAGRILFRVDRTGNYQLIGGIPTDGLVTMARNRAEPTQIGIVSDGTYWLVVNTTLTELSDEDLPAPNSIAVLDGYFILPSYSSRWSISDVDDGEEIDALDFASAESQPDPNVRVAVRESELVIFGAGSTEWWRNTGGDGFPFSRVQTMTLGCLSAASVAAVGQTLVWVASDGTVRLMQGYDGKVISSAPLQRLIEAEPDKSAIEATAWSQNGVWFYAVSGAAWSWIYNLSTGLWHERRSYGSQRWLASQVINFADMVIVGGDDGELYVMRDTADDEAGEPLVCEIDTPVAHGWPHGLTINALHLDVLTGRGLVPGDASEDTLEPHLMVSVSRDGGSSWGTERQLSLGTRGNRTKRVSSYRWGEFKGAGAVFRISASAAVARGFFAAAIEAEKLRV